MVCIVSSSIMNNSETDSNVNIIDEADETTELIELNDTIIDDNEDDSLKIKRIAGGNIIDYPPIFSPDGESLFVVHNEIVLVFSTITGLWLRNLEGVKNNIININYEINNQKIIVGCTETGEIIKWKWKSGNIEHKFQLSRFKDCKIQTFNLLYMSSTNPHALITYKKNNKGNVFWSIIDINTGNQLDCPLRINLSSHEVFVSTETNCFHYFVIAQNKKMFIVNYKNWRLMTWTSANKIPFTTVLCHPTEEMIATGDQYGRIFLWREFWQKQDPKTSLYHWHHTEITSIAFTKIGSGFYSSGMEAVLVKWNINRPDLKRFLPRMAASIRHIVVHDSNSNVAVATSDNGIQILDDQGNIKCVLQNFTHTFDDKTELENFSVGLRLNPRTNCLVLNGRIGYLQFYSTYTKSLLYNMDIVIQNRLSMETEKILYNTRVTKAAFNVDWMVTGEEWNDQVHSVELRLKFWEFKKENQSYCLNTNIELPHEGGFKALEFSEQHQSDNLLCASVGCDNFIKIWSLEDSDNIYKKGKVWYCVGRTNFKNMPIESVGFSLDGSLLAAGFGNSLCIYKTENLKIKTILTAPNCHDGVIQKLQIQIPKNRKQNQKSIKDEHFDDNKNESHKNLLKLVERFLENDDQQELITEIKKSKKEIKRKEINFSEFSEIISVKKSLKSNLFKKIQSLDELNLFQKLCIYQKLELFCNVSNEMQNKIYTYITSTIQNAYRKEMQIHNSINRISTKEKFKAKYRLFKYFNRKKSVNDTIYNKLIPLIKLLNFDNNNSLNEKQKILMNNNSKMKNNISDITKINGFCDRNEYTSDEEMISSSSLSTTTISQEKTILPVQNISSIKHIVFATGDYAHLVVVCTEHRILIWNILTLKLQWVLKLSVREICIDPITSLLAAFTTNNELYVFLPNAPMLYHRIHLPYVKSACWVPRKYPKSHSINLDWQSISTLYFLTDKQEIMCLASDNDKDDNLGIVSTELNNEIQDITRYTTFGTYATKQINVKVSTTNYQSSSSSMIGIPGKSSTKSLIELPTHAMAPANLLCHSFLRSLVCVEDNSKTSLLLNDLDATEKDSFKNTEEDDDEEDDTEFQKQRKFNQLLTNKSKLQTSSSNLTAITKINENEILRKILNENINLSF